MNYQIKESVKSLLYDPENAEVLARLAKHVKRSITYLPRMINAKDPIFTQKSVVQLLSRELNLSENEILEEVPEESNAVHKKKEKRYSRVKV